ncbi:MAG: DinB family protein [Gemmatimonadota bacterium]
MTGAREEPSARVPDAAGTAGDYAVRVLALLGDRDPFEVQAGLLPGLRAAVSGLDAETLRTPEPGGTWSVLDVVRHLADTELVYRYRMRMNVAQPGSDIAPYDQDAWAAGLRYRDEDLESTLAELEALRRANLAWLKGLTPEERARSGRHAERGLESVDTIVRLLAAHDLVHLRQIERIKGAVLGT